MKLRSCFWVPRPQLAAKKKSETDSANAGPQLNQLNRLNRGGIQEKHNDNIFFPGAFVSRLFKHESFKASILQITTKLFT